MKINVILFETVRSTDQLYTYNLSGHLEGRIRIGSRVLVPFGRSNRLVEAVVFEILPGLEPGYKQVHHLFEDGYDLSEEMVRLANALRTYYLSSYSRLVRTMVPSGSKREIKTEYVFGDEAARQAYEADKGVLDGLIEEGRVSLRAAYTFKGSQRQEKVVRRRVKAEEILEVLETLRPNAVRQKQALQPFIEISTKEIPLKDLGVPMAVLNPFIDKGLLEVEARRIFRTGADRDGLEGNAGSGHVLNASQQVAYDAIRAHQGQGTFLLHGITGSGKTEIYLHLTRDMLAMGRQVIVLVPEISLIPQMAQRFIERFGEAVAFYHSKMSASERMDEWYRIRTGEFKIVIGARSAVFAPFDKLGLIIIDEEHSKSYKSETEPKYDARHVARLRAVHHGIPMVLGSATPSIETHTDALNGRAILLSLNERATASGLPGVQLVDMRHELETGNRSIFSRALRQKMAERLERGEQTILFLNKKGYASFISCRSCGHVMKCPHCELPLIYHKRGHYGECRICSYKSSIPKTCPECGSPYFKHFGIGTERVEEMIGQVFPDARVIRMDSLSMQRKHALRDAYDGIRQGEYDIVLGTQIVAKGHDFKNVTLVGILAADINLNVPTFNASETAFQLLTQAIGRSGRGDKPGDVVIQTYSPDHYAVAAACVHDYGMFAEHERAVRRSLGYPPYRRLTNILVLSRKKDKAQTASRMIAARLGQALEGFDHQLVGPGPAILEKAKNLYRFQIILKFEEVDQRRIKGIIKEICEALNDTDIYLNIDVDPITLI